MDDEELDKLRRVIDRYSFEDFRRHPVRRVAVYTSTGLPLTVENGWRNFDLTPMRETDTFTIIEFRYTTGTHMGNPVEAIVAEGHFIRMRAAMWANREPIDPAYPGSPVASVPLPGGRSLHHYSFLTE